MRHFVPAFLKTKYDLSRLFVLDVDVAAAAVVVVVVVVAIVKGKWANRADVVEDFSRRMFVVSQKHVKSIFCLDRKIKRISNKILILYTQTSGHQKLFNKKLISTAMKTQIKHYYYSMSVAS